MKAFAVLILLSLAVALPATAERLYDFDFKGMDLFKALAQLAKLDDRSILFSGGVTSRSIDISLNQVTPEVALKLIVESQGYGLVEKHGIYHVVAPAERAPASRPTVILPLENALAKDLEAHLRTALGTDGTVTANEGMNALVVSGSESVVARAKSLVAELDQENAQVYIEAKIVEISSKLSRQLGVEWGPNVTAPAAFPGGGLAAPAEDVAFRAGVTTAVGNTNRLQARITAGERNGEVKIISQPRITTLNGMSANIESTTTFSIRTLAATQTTTTGGGAAGATTASPSVVGGIEKLKTGISLKVTPYIVSRRHVRLLLSLSKSDPDFSQRIDGIPGVSANSAQTSLVVHTGETASIGGLVHHSDSNNSNGVPFLSAIPLLGYVFGSHQKQKDDRELMILLTPTILRRGFDGKLAPVDKPADPEQKE